MYISGGLQRQHLTKSCRRGWMGVLDSIGRLVVRTQVRVKHSV